jgi:decaprenyl-phosphate phosphoribosyltransferase
VSMKIWLSAMRVHQWNKQALIILPFIALGDEVQVLDLGRLIVIAISFSLVASSIYIFNDLQDLAADKLDLVKSKRPFAAGVISTKKGKFVGVILLSTGFLVMFQVVGQNRPQVLNLFGLYLLSNLLYSRFNLKKIRILGLMIVGLGFAIRFSIGTFVLDLEFSTWAFVLILQLTMFMLSGKRFQTALRGTPPHVQESGLQFWLLSMVIFAAFFAATYSGFITDPEVVAVWGKEALIISTLPLGLGLVRFVELVNHPEKYLETDATESMTKDYLLLFLVTVFAAILFIGRLSV